MKGTLVFNEISNKVTRLIGSGKIKIKKYSPEALTTMAVVGVIGTAVLASRATLKLDETLEDGRYNVERVKAAHVKGVTPTGEGYSDQDYKRDMAIVWVQNAVAITKLYGPTILAGTATVACVLGSHKILRGRVVALSAAYKILDDQFNKYRDRVREAYSEEDDDAFMHGIVKKETKKVKDADGKEKEVTKTTVDTEKISQYARFFDESNVNWSKTPEYNLLFLRNQQNAANDKLHAQGHLFLNEVYDLLGIPRSQAGTITGWTLNKDDSGEYYGDGYVDFGLYDLFNEGARDFVNGYERSVLMDFNVDGVIWELI